MLMFNKGMLIYNNHAGDSDTEAKLVAVVSVLAQAVKELIIVRPETVEETREICDGVSNVDIVFILGGDGTVHECINRIARLSKRPLLGLLPGGTSNDFSRTLEIPQTLREAAESLVNGRVQSVDLGQYGSTYFMNFWGIGLVAEASQNIDEDQKKTFGALSYVASTFRTLKEAEGFPYRITSHGGELTGEAIAIFVLNGNSIATNRIPIEGINPSDGKLDLLVVKNSNLGTLWELLSLRNPKTDNETLDSLEYIQVTELQVDTPSQQQVDMDGEIYETKTESIRVLSSHLDMLVPL